MKDFSKYIAKRPLVWRTKDGREMFIKDMTDSHLTNAIKMVIRRIDEIHYSSNSSYRTTDLWTYINRVRSRAFGISDLLDEAKTRDGIDFAIFEQYANNYKTVKFESDESISEWAAKVLKNAKK
jgi:hypothetical protein